MSRKNLQDQSTLGAQDVRVEKLLHAWEMQYQQGRDVPVEEICRDLPALIEVLRPRIESLRDAHQQAETGAERPQPTSEDLPRAPGGESSEAYSLIPMDPSEMLDLSSQAESEQLDVEPETLGHVPGLPQSLQETRTDSPAMDPTLVPSESASPAFPAALQETGSDAGRTEDHSLIPLSNWEHQEPRDGSAGQAPTVPRRPTPSSDFPTIKGYQLLKELGRGGMGVVYKALDRRLKRTVALKMILGNRASAADLARFEIEAEAVAKLQHPNIVQIHEFGESDGHPFFALEFVEGGSLDAQIAGAPQPPPLIAQIMIPLSEGAHAAHEQGIIHRDLKPANVLLAQMPQSDSSGDGSSSQTGRNGSELGFQPKITDFGLAKQLDGEGSGQTQAGMILGTPSYMPPEQAEGHIADLGPLADVYSLGAILYEMLTGRAPFRGETVWDTLDMVRDKEPIPPRQIHPKCPRDLETICLKCLNKQPSARYGSARELADDVRRYVNGEPILARPAGRVERLVKWVKRSPARAAAVAGAFAFVVVFVIALYSRMEAAKKDAVLANQQKELLNKDNELLNNQRDLAQKQKVLLQQKNKLLEQESAKRERELREQQRLEKLRSRIAALYSSASKQATLATPKDAEAWSKVRQDVSDALNLITSEPALADFQLREPAQRLKSRADAVLADAKVWEEHRQRLAALREIHSDAVFFSTLASGVEQREGLEQAREAVKKGLALFPRNKDDSTIPDIDPRFYTPREAQYVLSTHYELLLIDAQVLATPQIGEKVGQWRDRVRQALTLLDQAEKLPLPVRPQVGLIRRADYLAKLNQKEEAARFQKLADEAAPSLAVDYFLLGMQLYRDRQFNDALKPLATALRLQPDHYGAEYLLATCRLQEKNWTTAKEGFSRCLQQRPDFPWPRLPRGYAEMMLGSNEAALADFQAVLDNPPDKTATYVALVNRSVLRMRSQQWKEALADLDEAIKTRPEALPAYVNKALTLRQRSEIPIWRQEVMLLAPQSATSALALELFRRQGRLDAIEVLDRAIDQLTHGLTQEEIVKKALELSRLYRERGRLHVKVDQFIDARQDFVRSIALAPNLGSSTLTEDLVELGRLLQREKKHLESIQAYEMVLKVRPSHALALRLMVEPLLSLKRYEEAGQKLDQYLETVPISSREAAPSSEEMDRLLRAFKARGLIHVKQNNFRAALESYAQALKLRRDPQVLTLRGWAYLTFNAPALAKLDFDESLKIQPGSADALLGRSDAQIKLGKVLEAVADVEAGLRADALSVRMRYNAARTYSQAVARLSASATDQNPDIARVREYQNRAFQLLKSAMEMTSPSERLAFWNNYVKVDRAFNSIRQHPQVKSLEQMARSADR